MQFVVSVVIDAEDDHEADAVRSAIANVLYVKGLPVTVEEFQP
jgi:hypothetical protein